MNLGIQDAYNLAWKLALVTNETAPDELLETYAKERMPAAEEVISQTSISGTLLVTANPVVKRFRDFVLLVFSNQNKFKR